MIVGMGVVAVMVVGVVMMGMAVLVGFPDGLMRMEMPIMMVSRW